MKQVLEPHWISGKEPESFPTSTKVVGEIYYSPMMKGWVVDLDGTGETVNIFSSKERAMEWVGNLLR